MANQVFVKDFHVEQELKNKGMELGVWIKDGKHLGDIQISKTGVTWCEGRSSKNVTKFSFDELNWIAFYKKEVLSAVKAARKKDGL
jgi:hypothetical protein